MGEAEDEDSHTWGEGAQTAGQSEARATPERRILDTNLPLTPICTMKLADRQTPTCSDENGRFPQRKTANDRQAKKNPGTPLKENGIPSSDTLILLVDD